MKYTERRHKNYLAKKARESDPHLKALIIKAYPHIDLEKLEKMMEEDGIPPDNPPKIDGEEANEGDWELDFLK